jgi:hypothetical protein
VGGHEPAGGGIVKDAAADESGHEAGAGTSNASGARVGCKGR